MFVKILVDPIEGATLDTSILDWQSFKIDFNIACFTSKKLPPNVLTFAVFSTLFKVDWYPSINDSKPLKSVSCPVSIFAKLL